MQTQQGAAVCGVVISVSRNDSHTFSKQTVDEVKLLAGLGVEEDAHAGNTVKHRSRVAEDPTQPNLRQVHLLQSELLDELTAKGFSVHPGDLGENILTEGIDLLDLPKGTQLRIGQQAIVEITGLRNPCWQIDAFQSGLLSAVVDRDAEGAIIRKAGVMGIVLQAGSVCPHDVITASMPHEPHERLGPV